MSRTATTECPTGDHRAVEERVAYHAKPYGYDAWSERKSTSGRGQRQVTERCECGLVRTVTTTYGTKGKDAGYLSVDTESWRRATSYEARSRLWTRKGA